MIHNFLILRTRQLYNKYTLRSFSYNYVSILASLAVKVYLKSLPSSSSFPSSILWYTHLPFTTYPPILVRKLIYISSFLSILESSSNCFFQCPHAIFSRAAYLVFFLCSSWFFQVINLLQCISCNLPSFV